MWVVVVGFRDYIRLDLRGKFFRFLRNLRIVFIEGFAFFRNFV